MESEIRNKGGKKNLVKKIFDVAGSVLVFIVIAFAFFVLVVSVTAKRDADGAATIFGVQLRFVQSDSMAKCDRTDVSQYKIKSIPVKSCVFIEVIPEDETEREEWFKTIKVGDVLTFKYVYQKQETITHRVVEKEEKPDGGYVITLEGDNKSAEGTVGRQVIDTSLADSPNYIIGRVTGQSKVIGFLVYALKSPVGIVCLIIVPCLIMIVFQVMRILKVMNEEKREKLAAEQSERADEIAELKRQIEQLKKENVKGENNENV